ncbi:MAG: hypothetical protein ABW104_02960 [Candidatus Thiodiazotropha sp. 6PLUC2]
MNRTAESSETVTRSLDNLCLVDSAVKCAYSQSSVIVLKQDARSREWRTFSRITTQQMHASGRALRGFMARSDSALRFFDRQ